MRLWWGMVVVAALPALAGAQSLADVARKEAERRQKNRQAGVKARVYTDEGTPRPAPSGSAAENVPATDVSSRSESGARSEDEGNRKEQYWRGRQAAAVARLDEARRDYERLNELWLAPGESYVDQKGRTVIRDLQHLRQLLAQAKAAVTAAEKAMSDLEDEARRAGALPGWLR